MTGACGQLGSELSIALLELIGSENVIISDINQPPPPLSELEFVPLDVLDKEAVLQVFKENQIEVVFHLAAMLSAVGEQEPRNAWTLNMDGLLNILEVSRNLSITKVFWPSSIAAFGPHTPVANTPQHTVMDPETIYGISKLAGELWCEYYHARFDLDVRSLRFPGLISYKSPPGGGTTDYAVAIFHSALKEEPYHCFLSRDTVLPMMYMPDAVRATLDLMSAPRNNITIRTSYNLAAFSVGPGELTSAIQKLIPGFSSIYQPDYRDLIAKTWPNSIDDSQARKDWNWRPKYGLAKVVEEMIKNLTPRAD